ncbi:PCS3 [Symbiodinium natans]|uniref:glutathione gamma-glutamylcysteinyltransferase n=1 Tax=Symbiodinium natans TaxID=878477 RepID=A0A812LCV4_9DINO|nr:PCS3 [Symbiodinium natans]
MSPLIPLASPAGAALLEEATTRLDLIAGHRRQVGLTMCGVRTLCLVLSAGKAVEFDDTLNEHSKDTHEQQLLAKRRGDVGPSLLDIETSGMSLPQFVEMVTDLDVPGLSGVDIHHADDSPELRSAEDLRRLLLAGIDRPTTFPVVNYHMTTLGQGTGDLRGHFSPVAAYHEDQDAFLVMDTWTTTEPVFAKTADLWRSINTPDSASGKQRGVALVTITPQSTDAAVEAPPSK